MHSCDVEPDWTKVTGAVTLAIGAGVATTTVVVAAGFVGVDVTTVEGTTVGLTVVCVCTVCRYL